MSCRTISLCPGKDRNNGNDGIDGQNACLITLESYRQCEVRVDSNKPLVAFLMPSVSASDLPKSIEYDMIDIASVTKHPGAFAFTTPRNGMIKNLAIHAIVEEKNGITIPNGETLTLNFQILKTNGLTDYKLKHLSGSKISFKATEDVARADTFEKIIKNIDHPVKAGDQISVVFWGNLTGQTTKLKPKFALTGGITLTQEL